MGCWVLPGGEIMPAESGAKSAAGAQTSVAAAEWSYGAAFGYELDGGRPRRCWTVCRLGSA
jgi:hypothetical protein